MHIEGLREAVFLERINRFACHIEREGRVELCHVPNSGRLRELLISGARAWVIPARPGRKTASTLIMVENRGVPVMIDAHRTNDLLEEGVRAGMFDFLEGAEDIRREVKFNKSRMDMGCRIGDEYQLIEAKCATLVEGETALFPDAPTDRGCRHVEELMKAREAGFGAHLIFIVQHPLAVRFMPNAGMDSRFAGLVARAEEAGVSVKAYGCAISGPKITIYRELITKSR